MRKKHKIDNRNIEVSISGVSRETEPLGSLLSYIKRFVIGTSSHSYGTEKSHSLPSASWKIRKARGVMQLKSEV